MTNLLLQDIEKKFIDKKTPILRPGYQVRVHQKIKEGNKERIQVFEGLIISLNAGHGASKTFTVRKVVQGIGVEKIFPVYSPNISKIEVKKTFKTRRGKLTFLRKEGGLSKRLSVKLGLLEKDELLKQRKGLVEEQESTISEAVEKAEEEEEEAKKEVNTEEGTENLTSGEVEEVKSESKEPDQVEPEQETAPVEQPTIESVEQQAPVEQQTPETAEQPTPETAEQSTPEITEQSEPAEQENKD